MLFRSALQVNGIDGTAVVEALRREAVRRAETLSDGLPTTFGLEAAQAEEWHRRWSSLIRQPPISFDQALLTSERFLAPVLDGRAQGKRWASGSEQWDSVG